MSRRHSRSVGAGIAFAALLTSACGQTTATSGEANPGTAFDAISADETVRLVGTEPFWGGSVAGGEMVYTTPDNPQGTTVPVKRFAGMNGLAFSGALSGRTLDLLVTQAPCSDGMSDRSYPFTATLQIGEERRLGCAWTARMPYRENGPGN